MRTIVTLFVIVLTLIVGCQKKSGEAVFIGGSEPAAAEQPEKKSTVVPEQPSPAAAAADAAAEPGHSTAAPLPAPTPPEKTPEEALAELKQKTEEAEKEAQRKKDELVRQERLRKQAEDEAKVKAETQAKAEEIRKKAEESKKGFNNASPVSDAAPLQTSPVNTKPPVKTESPVKQNLSLTRLYSRLALFGILLLQNTENVPAATPAPASRAAEPEKTALPTAPVNNTSNIDKKPAEKVRFNFRYTPWKEAIEWFADQAAVSLQADSLPSGTLNLTDNQYYTPAEALDVLNSYLLFKEYTIIRKGKSLFIIYLPDGIPPNLLEPITADELDNRGKYEICRCVFKLNRTVPDIIQAEVEKLLGPQGSLTAMPKSQQIVVTETAGTLRTIRDIIKRIDDPEALASGTLQTIEPKNLSADEALGIMRKLLAIDENDASLRTAVDASGKIIWMTGRGDMIERAKEIIKSLDDSFAKDKPQDGQPQFHVFETGSADPATVLAVLQTLLAGTPDVRMSLDAKTGGIAVLGRPANLATVREAIKQMQLNTPQIDVIPLKRISPLSAVESIKKFFATASPAAADSTAKTPIMPVNVSAPIVEADTAAQQIIVRGTLTQIQQIRVLLNKLGEDGIAGVKADTSTVRTISIPSAATPYILEQLQNVLPKINPNIKIVTPQTTTPENKNNNDGTEERINKLIDATFEKELTAAPQRSVTYIPCQYPSQTAGTPQPVIVTITPAGLMISSDDTAALNQVEGLLRMLSDETMLGKTEMKVHYLKNSTAEVVSATLRSLLDAGSAEARGVSGAGGGISDEQRAAVLGYVAQGNTIEKTGQVSLAADARLNALLIQANPVDHKTIERLLPILDQPSRDDILNRARPRLIPLKNIRAEEALTTVETVFSGRMQGGTSGQNAQGNAAGGRGRNAGGNNNNQQQVPMPGMPPGMQGMPGMPPGGPGMIMQQIARLGNQGGSPAAPKEAEEKMTLGTDSRSNSLIVSAPESLFLEVKAFVEELDAVAAQQETVVETVSLKNINSSVAQQAIANTLGSSVTFTTNKAAQQQPAAATGSPFGSPFGGGFGNSGSPFGTTNRGGFGGGLGNGGFGGQGGGTPANANPFLNMMRGGMGNGGLGGGFGGGGIGGGMMPMTPGSNAPGGPQRGGFGGMPR
jgi:type II secretory pathway component GspD/PulD (secretin)